MSIGINLDKEVKKILDQYSQDINDSISESLKAIGKEASRKLRATSPKKTGKYAKGWTYQAEKGRVTNSVTVYGKKNTYPLAHLLEHGHAKRGGGRVPGIVHIKPVEEWAIAEAEKAVREAAEK